MLQNPVVRIILAILVLLLFLGACVLGPILYDPDPAGTADNSEATGIAGELTIFAAASLTEAFEMVAEEYSDASFSFNFAGSSVLRTQLGEGAEADVFASANWDQMEGARDAGRIDGDPVVFAQNRLVLIVPADNPAGLDSPADLADPGILLVLAEEQVPVGNYSRQALEVMSQDSEYGDDFQGRVLENLVSEEPNVRAVATRVQLGEADAGVVYASDVTPDLRDDVMVIDIPDEFNVIAEYPVAIVEGAANPEEAQAFIDFLISPRGQEILAEFGFIPLD